MSEHPISELEKFWIGKYERSMHVWKAANNRGVLCRQHRFQKRYQSPMGYQCKVAMCSPNHLDARTHSRVVLVVVVTRIHHNGLVHVINRLAVFVHHENIHP